MKKEMTWIETKDSVKESRARIGELLNRCQLLTQTLHVQVQDLSQRLDSIINGVKNNA